MATNGHKRESSCSSTSNSSCESIKAGTATKLDVDNNGDQKSCHSHAEEERIAIANQTYFADELVNVGNLSSVSFLLIYTISISFLTSNCWKNAGQV